MNPFDKESRTAKFIVWYAVFWGIEVIWRFAPTTQRYSVEGIARMNLTEWIVFFLIWRFIIK